MHFEYQRSVIGVNNIPDLCIQVSDIIKTKNYKTDEMAFAERESLLQALRIYTYYCGNKCTLISKAYDDFLSQTGKTGKVIISCIESSQEPQFIVRVISNDGEKEIDCHFSKCI